MHHDMLTSFMPYLGNLNDISCLCLDKWGLTYWFLVYFLKHDPWVGSLVNLVLFVHKRSKDPLRVFVCLFVYLGPWSGLKDPRTPSKPTSVLLMPHPFIVCFNVYVDCVYFGVCVDCVCMPLMEHTMDFQEATMACDLNLRCFLSMRFILSIINFSIRIYAY